jgi:hypothetical protein
MAGFLCHVAHFPGWVVDSLYTGLTLLSIRIHEEDLVRLKSGFTISLGQFLLLLVLTVFVPASKAEDGTVLGVITSAPNVMVNGASVSAGTTLFSGDTVEVFQGVSLVQFADGNRLEMTKAKATFIRNGQRLHIQVHSGLIRFNFKPWDDTLISTSQYRLGVHGRLSRTVGGLMVNEKGQFGASICKGKLKALNSREVEMFTVNPNKSVVVADPDTNGTQDHEKSAIQWLPIRGQTSLTTMSLAGLAACMTPPPVPIMGLAAGAALGVELGVAVQDTEEDKSLSSRH